jgi:proteasome lid subunit RPN8/RPN11
MPGRIAAGLRRHAAAAAPLECCGALIGRTHCGRTVLRAALPLENRAAAHGYLISAPTVRRLELRAARAGLEVVGFYHSHPRGGPVPSRADLELAWPGYVYAIVDVIGGAVRCWRLRHDRTAFAELSLALALAAGAP